MEIAMGEVLALHAERHPERTAVVCGDRKVSYRELDERSNSAAHELLRRGVSPGDIVALVLPNGVELFVAAFAAWKCGATPFPMSAALPESERAALLEVAAPALVVTDAPAGLWPTLTSGDLAEASHVEEPLPATRGEQPWKAIGSGGSTGRPKVVLAGRPATVDPETAQYTVEPGDVVLAPGPLYHQGPFIFTTAALFTGGTAITMERFDAHRALELIAEHRVTWTYLVPTMTHRIWRLPEQVRHEADLSSLRLLVSTGAPWAAWLKAEWLRWLGPDRVLEWYGGTEEQGGLSITGAEALAHPGAIGRAHPDVRVVDDAGRDLPTGEVGELVFRRRPGPEHQVLGGHPEAAAAGDPAEAWREAWRSYGDFARIDEDGYVHLADRRTDLVVSGGVNVYPAEVEGALEAHPAVRCAVVVGLPDDDLGQRVHAIVQVDPQVAPVTAEHLRHHLRERIARPKVPRTFELVDHELRDDTGKVRRLALRAERLHPAVRLAKPAVDVAVVVADLDRSLRFYRDTLSLPVRRELPVPGVGRMVILAAGESGLKLLQLDRPVAEPTRGGLSAGIAGLRYCTFPVLDLDAAVGRCRTAGYDVVARPRAAAPGIRVAAVEDPDGNWVELLESSPAPEAQAEDADELTAAGR